MKPTQHSVNELQIGIHPDAVVCRLRDLLSEETGDKIALADVDTGAVFSFLVPDVYLVPEHLMAEGLTRLSARLRIADFEADSGEWKELDLTDHEQREEVEIALVGKYVKLHDAYLSVHEALKHAGVAGGARACPLGRRRGHVLRGSGRRARAGRRRARTGGFGSRGWEGKIPRAASPASAVSRTWASASMPTSPCRSSHGTSSGSTAPTRPRWTSRRPIR